MAVNLITEIQIHGLQSTVLLCTTFNTVPCQENLWARIRKSQVMQERWTGAVITSDVMTRQPHLTFLYLGEYSDVKVTRGKEHNYLGAKLIFEDDGVIVDMRKYLQEMCDEFPGKLTGNAKTPANDNLFRIMNV